MTGLHDLFEDVTATPPPSRLTASGVLRVSRFRRRRRVATVAVAAGLVLTVAGVTLQPGPAGPPHPSAGSQPGGLVWAGRGDAGHVYVVRSNCVIEPSLVSPSPGPSGAVAGCFELFASEDGGATWASRGPVHDHQVTILGPRVVLRSKPPAPASPGGPTASRPFEISQDAGRTWSAMPDDGPPIDAIPAGSGLLPLQTPQPSPGFAAYDLDQGRLRPLAHQPNLLNYAWSMPITNGDTVWITGSDPVTLGPVVAVSHDRGLTWHQEPLPDTGTERIVGPSNASTGSGATDLRWARPPYPLASRDGVTAYVSIYDSAAAQPPVKLPGLEDDGYVRVFRTTDGGLTWHELATGAVAPGYTITWLTDDGRLVLGIPVSTEHGFRMVFAASADALTYTLVSPPGLPTGIITSDGSLAVTEDAVYLSDDGWTWREARLP